MNHLRYLGNIDRLLGADIVLLARSESPLEVAKHDVLAVRGSTKQTVDTISIDLTNSSEVRKYLSSKV
jgi:short-subunit dehydrogenase